MSRSNYDAILLVSFGGPERREDVIPFLENVLRGRDAPRERMLAVAEHYYRFDGKTPINAQNRALQSALRQVLADRGWKLPVYWGNRNWHPMLTDTMRRMEAEGVRRALAFVTSAYSSYSGCRQYRENIAAAREAVGPGAPEIDKLRVFFNHPGFIAASADRVRDALDRIPIERRAAADLVYTAHSIPRSMAETSSYQQQLLEACRLTAESLGRPAWRLVFQSRSGAPGQPWLEPDICDYIRERAAAGMRNNLVIAPIGFLSDHMEVLYDLDTEVRELCLALGIRMERAATVGVHPRFVDAIAGLIAERVEDAPPRFLGEMGLAEDQCAPGCCPPPVRPARVQ